jgi:hypothetical protein
MDWTKEKPTEPGAYRFRDRAGRVMDIEVRLSRLAKGKHLEARARGWKLWLGVPSLIGEWQGPIEPQEGAANVD